jgi:hypothetical protein
MSADPAVLPGTTRAPQFILYPKPAQAPATTHPPLTAVTPGQALAEMRAAGINPSDLAGCQRPAGACRTCRVPARRQGGEQGVKAGPGRHAHQSGAAGVAYPGNRDNRPEPEDVPVRRPPGRAPRPRSVRRTAAWPASAGRQGAAARRPGPGPGGGERGRVTGSQLGDDAAAAGVRQLAASRQHAGQTGGTTPTG